MLKTRTYQPGHKHVVHLYFETDSSYAQCRSGVTVRKTNEPDERKQKGWRYSVYFNKSWTLFSMRAAPGIHIFLYMTERKKLRSTRAH